MRGDAWHNIALAARKWQALERGEIPEDMITRATNALYDIRWGDALRQGMIPVNPQETIAVLRLEAIAILKAAFA
jgi:hypothetical protein